MLPLLSTADAAELLGVVPLTLRHMIDAGELPAYRVGRLIKVRPEDLERYLDANRVAVGRAG